MTPVLIGRPTHLGKYEVRAKIGGGGMASVYIGHAKKENGEDELVALKVIRDELAHDETFTNMFVDEAKILARLSHPNVIHTLEYGITGAHRFIAMELLTGRTYADVWDLLAERGEQMPLRLGAWICARVADGLHSAHELVDAAGSPLHVIHRDVNPSNIFLTHSGDVKLIDFGLAKARERTSKSGDGIVKGKIPYLAPEQAKGQPIDRRVDLYALGSTLWETATMKRLFKRDTDVETLLAIRDAVVPDLRQTIEGFPDAMWAIIDKATQRDRDARYATSDDLRRDLDTFVGDASDMPKELTSLLARLFPGQEAELAKWARDATALRVPKYTMPPPAPVPTASSTLLEDDVVPPASVRDRPASMRPDGKKSGAPTTSKKTPKKKKKKKKKRPDALESRVAPATPTPRNMWLSALVVAAIAIAVLFALCR